MWNERAVTALVWAIAPRRSGLRCRTRARAALLHDWQEGRPGLRSHETCAGCNGSPKHAATSVLIPPAEAEKHPRRRRLALEDQEGACWQHPVRQKWLGGQGAAHETPHGCTPEEHCGNTQLPPL